MRSFAGMVGILALATASIIGALAATGVLSDAATNTGVGESEVKEPKVEKKFPEATVSIEESVRVGDLAWDISEARRTHELRSFTYPKSTIYGHFIVITFSVENTSDGPITLSDEDMALHDKESGIKSYPAASVNSEYVPPIKDLLFTEERLLEPGEKAEGRVNFDLDVPFAEDPALDLLGFELVLGDGDPTTKVEKSVDLGL